MAVQMKPTFSCTTCGKVKAEANHWWMGKVSLEGARGYKLVLWSDDDLAHLFPDHFCGEGCAFKHVSRVLGAST